MNDCNFKVGQTVWCLIYGKGKVVTVDQADVYPITVEFDNVDFQYYTGGGKYHVDGNRTLFFSEPKIEVQDFPSKYEERTVFLVNARGTHGPFKITKEDTKCIYSESACFYKEKYHIYIVEQDKE